MKARALAVLAAGLTLVTVAGSSAAHASATAQPLGKFKLPYSGSISSGTTAFKVANTGSGNAIEGDSGGNGAGIEGTTTTGEGVYGNATGTGSGVFGSAGANGHAGVSGASGGAEPGVTGSSTSGPGVLGTTSTGFAGVAGQASGQNNGVYGYANNQQGSAVYGQNDGSGNGLTGYSASGNGVLAQGSGTNHALSIASGGIQVYQAGVDTPTPAFIHQVANANLCNGGLGTILNNPFLNGKPNAMVFAYPSSNEFFQVILQYGPGGSCPTTQWVAWSFSLVGNNRAWNMGDTFNVLALNP